MRTVIIVQARMGSTRLPGKVLLEVMGRPLLDYQMERLSRCARAASVAIATTTSQGDQPLVEFCRARGIPCFRGDEQDVLSRYHGAAREFRAEAVVRATADCPLIDPAIVDRVIARLEEDQALDYVSSVLERTYPRGMDCEAFRFAALDAAHREAVKPAEREHVTPFIWANPGRFRLAGVSHSNDLSRHRWTVDTPEDFALIRNLLEEIHPANPRFGLEDCLAALERHPDWPLLNAEVEQKKTFT